MNLDQYKLSTPPNFDHDENEDIRICRNCGNEYFKDESNSDFSNSWCSVNCEHSHFEKIEDEMFEG